MNGRITNITHCQANIWFYSSKHNEIFFWKIVFLDEMKVLQGHKMHQNLTKIEKKLDQNLSENASKQNTS